MEDVLDGCIVKPADAFSAIRETFSKMTDDIASKFNSDNAEEAALLVNNSYQIYEDATVRNDELDRLEDKLVIENGVSQQMRGSMEAYVDAEDETLPIRQMYTQEPSMVNYDATLTWVRDKLAGTQTQEMQAGALFAAVALYWVKQYAIESDDELSVEALVKRGSKQEATLNEFIQNPSVDLAEAQVGLFEVIQSLNLNPNDFDTHLHDSWSGSTRKRKMLDQLVTPALGGHLNGLTMGLVNECKVKEDFKDYLKLIERILKELIATYTDIAEGRVTLPDLSNIEGGIRALNEATTRFTLLVSEEGIGDTVNLTYVNDVLNVGADVVELLDDDYAASLMSLRESFTTNYNLESPEQGMKFTVAEPFSMLNAIHITNSTMSSLLDAHRLVLSVYNSLNQLATAKNNLVNTYSVFLQSLSD